MVWYYLKINPNELNEEDLAEAIASIRWIKEEEIKAMEVK